MTHLLDSNACISCLRQGPNSTVSLRLQSAPVGSVVVGELLSGALRSARPDAIRRQVINFLAGFVSVPVDDRVAEQYALIKAHLAVAGTPIGPNDLLIAATALARGLTLVTHNTAEFSRVPGLAFEDWQIP